MKKTLSMILGMSTIFASFAFAFILPVMAAAPNWDTTGDYVTNMELQGSDNFHDMTLYQDEYGNLTGNGGSPAGNNTYLWTIQDGVVIDDTIEFTADYTATPDAVTPQTTLDVVGAIASDGTMSGTWSDNYQGEARAGTWSTTEGVATAYPTEDSSMVTVTIDKYIQGTMATAATANNADFPMTSTWYDQNTGNGTGAYTLSETNSTPYQAITSEMTKGSDYQTQETLDGYVVGAQCSEGKPFALQGYTYGDSKAEAMTATPSMTMPSFTNLQTDKFVIVWNQDCNLPAEEIGGETNGHINGDVIAPEVALEVTSIEMVKTSATANGSFEDGWEYVFHITAPMSEDMLAMKFSDWLQTNGAGTIMVANNMRISSLQANNNGAPVLLTAADTYSTPELHMTGDLNPAMDGRQVEIKVEVAIPNGTPNGSYTTSYGVQSNE